MSGTATGSDRLGFIGLGLMGGPMARRLLGAGLPVTVWNRSAAKTEPVVAAGGMPADGPASVARASDIVFACLTDTKAMRAAVFGPGGLAEGMAPGSVLVDFTSMSPEATREMAAELMDRCAAHWLDAPVSGGVPGAEAGTLAIMAGGDAAVFDRVAPHVAHMAARFTLMGPQGAGQTTKLCNQVIVGCTMAVLAEATRLATSAGVDPMRLPEALAGGFADSKPLQLFVPRMAQAQHDPPLGHAYTMLKDLDEVGRLARSLGTPTPFTAQAAELFRLLTLRGGDEADALEIYKLTAKTPL